PINFGLDLVARKGAIVALRDGHWPRFAARASSNKNAGNNDQHFKHGVPLPHCLLSLMAKVKPKRSTTQFVICKFERPTKTIPRRNFSISPHHSWRARGWLRS